MKYDINLCVILIYSSFGLSSLIVRLIEDHAIPHAGDQVVHGLVKPVDRRGDNLLLVSGVGIFGIGFSFLYLLPGFFWPCGSAFLPYGDLLPYATALDVEEAYDKPSADYHNSDDGIGSDNCVDDDCDGPGVALLRFFSRPPA